MVLPLFTLLFSLHLCAPLPIPQRPNRERQPSAAAKGTGSESRRAQEERTPVASAPSQDGTPVASAPSQDSTPVAGTPSQDGTPVAGTPSQDSTPVAGASSQDGTPVASDATSPKRKVVYKTVDPGFRTPPLFRVSPMGPNAVWAGVGVKAGITDHSTGGLYLHFGYAYRLSTRLWTDLSLSMNFGGDCTRPSPESDAMECGGMNGFGLDILGGLMYRFLKQPNWKLPLNPYVRVLGGVSFIISNGPNDGAALVVKGVGGARYSFNEEFAVGAELGFTTGSAFRNVSGVGFSMSVDFMLNVEYAF